MLFLGYTLESGNYDSFAVAILNQNHKVINVVELLSISIKVIIEGFPDNVIMDNMAASLTVGV